MKMIDSRNRDPEPPVILDPLVVLLSSRAVTAAMGMWKDLGLVEKRVIVHDWIAC